MIFFTPFQVAGNADQAVLRQCEDELDRIWDASMKDPDLDTYVCSREELLAAIKSAPDATSRQILYADFRFREWVSMAKGVAE